MLYEDLTRETLILSYVKSKGTHQSAYSHSLRSVFVTRLFNSYSLNIEDLTRMLIFFLKLLNQLRRLAEHFISFAQGIYKIQ